MIHLTSWNIDEMELNKIYSTCYTTSNYWKYMSNTKEKDDNLCNDIKKIGKSFGVNIDKIADKLTLIKKEKQINKEEIFEKVRKKRYQNLPSRKNCMFLFPDNCNIEEMRDKFRLSKELRQHIVRISGVDDNSNQITVDSSLLNCDFINERQIEINANKYWSGEVTINPLIEILLCGKFIITEIIE